MQKGKLRDKPRQFIDLMRKDKLKDKVRKFIDLMGKGKLSEELRKLIAIVVLEIIVFGLAFGIVVSFFPDYADIYNAIIILFISAIGITVILYGNATRNRYLNVMGLLILLFAVYIVIEIYEGFAVKISAFATLAVAIAAFAAIEENRRIRRDSIERESRDRRERWVDEVAKWLRELEGRILPKSSAFYSGVEDKILRRPEIPAETWLESRTTDVVMEEMHALDEGIKEAEYYQKLTLQLNEELSSLIEVIANNLGQRRQLHVEAGGHKFDYRAVVKASRLLHELIENDDRPLEDLGLSEQDITTVHFGRNRGAIRKSIVNAVDKAIELKTSFIQVS